MSKSKQLLEQISKVNQIEEVSDKEKQKEKESLEKLTSKLNSMRNKFDGTAGISLIRFAAALESLKNGDVKAASSSLKEIEKCGRE